MAASVITSVPVFSVMDTPPPWLVALPDTATLMSVTVELPFISMPPPEFVL